MKNIHLFLWTLFITIIVILSGQKFYISNHGGSLQILNFETANTSKVKTLLDYYSITKVNGVSLLYYVRINTVVDFFFIVSYVSVLIMVSYSLMQKEKNITLNNLLRFNMLLAIVAGLFDVGENIILLRDINNYLSSLPITSAMYVSYAKWTLIAFIVTVWMVSFSLRMFSSTKYRKGL